MTRYRPAVYRPTMLQPMMFHPAGQTAGTGCLGLLVWPIVVLGKMITGVIKVAGRLLALLLGFVLMIVGALLCLTIIGAFVGVPLLLLGLALVVRSLF